MDANKTPLGKYRRASNANSTLNGDCGNCPFSHARDKCPAAKLKCGKCNKMGHFPSKCPSKPSEGNTSRLNARHIKVNAVSHDSPMVPLNILATPCNNDKHLSALATIKFIPDTGAECDIISLKTILTLSETGLVEISPDDSVVTGPDGEKITNHGVVHLKIGLGSKRYNTEAQILQGGSPLLSKKGCKALGIVEPGWPLSVAT